MRFLNISNSAKEDSRLVDSVYFRSVGRRKTYFGLGYLQTRSASCLDCLLVGCRDFNLFGFL